MFFEKIFSNNILFINVFRNHSFRILKKTWLNDSEDQILKISL